MRAARPIGAALVLVAAVALGACGGEEPDAPAAQGPQDPVSAGERAYVANCASCHGVGGAGTDVGPPLVHIVYEPSHHDDDSFRRAVADGVVPHHWEFGPMPAFPAVPDKDVEAIISYVRALQREAGIQ
jgi:mono/diheme cytochrome c family protein